MIFTTTVILFVLTMFNTSFEAFGVKTKRINLLSDILTKGDLKVVPLPEVILNDSIIAQDSAAYALRKADPTNILDFYISSDSSSALAHFFNSLNRLKKNKGKTRIAYFGDSMIEGDLITQDFRKYMQDAFGGKGVGYMPITSIVAGFRRSIKHKFGEWKTYNLIEEEIPEGHNLGMSGYVFVPVVQDSLDPNDEEATSWVKYSGVNKRHLERFYQTKLLYGKSDGENSVTINGSKYDLSGQSMVNQLMIESNNGLTSINAQFECETPMDVYGFSMESDSGVFVDNFSFRGNSGMPLSRTPKSVFKGTNNFLKYDLIILEYGLNVIAPNVTDYSWYERGMTRTINHLKACFPNTSILVISVGDKGYRNEGVYETDPAIPLLVKSQKSLAQKTNSAYWSLYDAMGGYGSMVRWVEGDTVYATKDYTHFNYKGAHRIGKLLFKKLMSEYNDYNKKRKQNL